LYGRSAFYYDIIYSWKNYKKESEIISRFIRRYKKSPGNSLLDVACGTGNHIEYLKRKYSVEGLDVNRSMLNQAKRKHPDVRFYQGDMRTFRLGKKYDIITCLFSAIGHVRARARLRKAISSMALHLKPGGLMELEPWITPGNWRVGYISANYVNRPNLKLARFGTAKLDGRLSVNEMYHLVVSAKGVEYFTERLVMGLFSHSEYLGALKEAGLRVIFDKKGLTGRGLYLGLKPIH
jgi:ubiquinone/menaquinone biosynthesis C-methylase UbiE